MLLPPDRVTGAGVVERDRNHRRSDPRGDGRHDQRGQDGSAAEACQREPQVVLQHHDGCPAAPALMVAVAPALARAPAPEATAAALASGTPRLPGREAASAPSTISI